VIEAFTKKFGIEVDASVGRPSTVVHRVKTEQDNGQYVSDIWWAITSNMVNVAAPAGMLAPFEDYLILPEVKDPSNWRHPDYMYGDKTHHVFTYIHEVNTSAFRNSAVLPDVKITSIDDLMNPKLKGKIAVRDSSDPNAGSFSLSPIYRAKGPEFLRNFLQDMNPKVFANPQQLDTALFRGGVAVATGIQYSSYADCKQAGGCQTISEIPGMYYISSRGLSVFKNPPHPEAVKVFLNWFLSKEGQELWVQEWAKANITGAVSHRKDVAPAKGHERFQPDFSKADQYVWTSNAEGSAEINNVVKIFRDVIGN
jgi:iron(III) transport system substrate-binding protein